MNDESIGKRNVAARLRFRRPCEIANLESRIARSSAIISRNYPERRRQDEARCEAAGYAIGMQITVDGPRGSIDLQSLSRRMQLRYANTAVKRFDYAALAH